MYGKSRESDALYHAGTMHKVAWRHSVTLSILEYMYMRRGHEKVSSGNLGSGTLADKTPAHWPRPTENWWSDPQSELLDWQNPETGPKLSADPRSTVFFKSANPLDLSPKSTIRELFKAKSADPRTYSPPSSKKKIVLASRGFSSRERVPAQSLKQDASCMYVI